jgi:hypothetical protein
MMKSLVICALLTSTAALRIGGSRKMTRVVSNLRMSFEDDFTVAILGDLHLDPR